MSQVVLEINDISQHLISDVFLIKSGLLLLCVGEKDAAGLVLLPEDQLFPFQIGSVHSDPVAKQLFRADLFQLLPQLVH